MGSMDCRACPRSRSAWGLPGGRRSPGFVADAGGQFLLFSGVLLVLGFLVFASTVVTLNATDERTYGAQQNRMMDDVQEIVATLDGTLASMHRPGQMNQTVFQEAAGATEEALEKNAVRSGLFASIRLAENPDLVMVETAQNCLGLDPDASAAGGGVIYGWDLETLEKSIVGAVYEIHITNGESSFQTDHYAKLQDCAADEIFTHADQWGGPLGFVKNFSAGRVDDDLAMDVTEELDWDNLVAMTVHPEINQSTVEVHRWNKEDNLLNLDGTYTEMPSRSASLPDNNWFHFRVEPPERMRPGDDLPNVTLEITGYKNVEDDQTMYLRVFKDDTWADPVIDREVALPTSDPDLVEIVLDEYELGQGNWTYDNITESHWELAVTGPHNSNQAWNVDHFNMTGSIMTAQAYRLNLSFDWPGIPDVYQDHELLLEYRLDPATVDEGFRLEVRDRDGLIDDGKWMLVHNMTDTTAQPDGWSTGAYPEAEGSLGPEPLPNRMELRVVDTDQTDNWIPEDEDTVEIRLLRVKSQLGG